MPRAKNDQPQEFPTTWWTLIGQALADGTTDRNVALEQLVLLYTPPLRAHLVLRKRLNDELADELLQAFVVEKIAAQYLFHHADRSRGKFRALLVRSLENYYVDWVRSRAIEPVTGQATFDDGFVATAQSEADTFDVAWARQLLGEVLATMRADCEANNQADVWGVFECRLLLPLQEGSEPLTYHAVCERFSFESPEQASNALVTAKRKFKRAFERVAAAYRHDGESDDDVLRELIGILSQAGPLRWQQVPDAFGPLQSSSNRPEDELHNSQPTLVAQLLQTAPDVEQLWLPDDLAAFLQHLLAQRLSDLDLSVVEDSIDAARPPAIVAPLVTLGQLFAHPAPPLPLLEAVKRYGRNHARRLETTLPTEIASMLYFGTIAAALVIYNRRITTSDDELLRFGFKSMLGRSWIQPPLDDLFRLGLNRLKSTSSRGQP